MKTFDDFIKDANSILNTLNKDYEAMQSQKSDVRQDQAKEYADLCDDMNSILMKYSKTIWDFRNKVDSSIDAEGPELTVYEYPNTDRMLVIIPQLYWTGNRVPVFEINLIEKPKFGGCGYYSRQNLRISETGIEYCSDGFNDKGFSDSVSIFLNHRPTHEQLDTVFQAALTDYVKCCVARIQKRNENLADKIKSITR